MNFDIILEFAYHSSGILTVLFLIAVTIVLRKEKKEIIKSRLFLNYEKFRSGFYIALAGGLFFLVGNVVGVFDSVALRLFHDISEIIFNLCLAVFVAIIFFILRKKDMKGYLDAGK